MTPVGACTIRSRWCGWRSSDAYGAEERREAENGDEVAFRTERVHRSVCRAVAEYSFRTAARTHARVYGGPKWTVSPVYEGMLKEEMDAASERFPDVPYQPQLIDVTYAGLVGGAAVRRAARDPGAEPRRRLPVGARAGAVRVDRGSGVGAARPSTSSTHPVVMTEAPHGTAPALEGKDIANPMAMILAAGGAAALSGRGGRRRRRRPRRARCTRRCWRRRGRYPHARPRRPRHHVRGDRRGDRSHPHQARDLEEPRRGAGADETTCVRRPCRWRSRRPATGLRPRRRWCSRTA